MHEVDTQLALDALSDLLDVPINLLNKLTFEDIYRALSVSEIDHSEYFPSLSNVEEFFLSPKINHKFEVFNKFKSRSYWRYFFRDIELILYKTRPQNSDLLFHKLREHWFWRWSEVYLLTRLAIFGIKENVHLELLDKNVFNRVFEENNALNCYVQVGPTKRTDSEVVGSSLKYFSKHVEALKMFVGANDLRLIYDQTELNSHLSDRFGMPKTELFVRLSKATDVMSSLHDISERCVVGVSNKLIKTLVGVLYASSHFKPFQDSPYRVSNVDCVGVDAIVVLICSLEKPERAQKNKVVEKTRLKNLSLTISYSGDGFPNDGVRDFVAELIRYIRNLGERINTKETLRTTESLTLIQEVLSEKLNFSFDTICIDDLYSDQKDIGRLNELAFQLAKIIARATSADGVRILHYNRSSMELTYVGGFREGRSRSATLKVPLMRLKRNDPLSNYSIGFGAIKALKTQAYSEDRRINRKRGGQLFDWNEAVLQPEHGSPFPSAKSAVATPVLINGIAWGVIEIASSRLSNFGRNEISFLIKASEVIGNDFHALHIKRLFSNLATEIYDNKNRDLQGNQESLKILSQRIADLFLGTSAAIWIRDVYHSDIFKLMGFARDNNQDGDYFFNEVREYDISDENSITGDMFRSDEKFYMGNFGEGRFSESWMRSLPRRQRLFELFRGMMIICFYDTKGKPVGSVSVYFEHKILENNWRELGVFIADYISTIIVYLFNFNLQEAGRLGADRHEINNNINSITRRMNRLKDVIKKIAADGEDIQFLMNNELRVADEDISGFLKQIKMIASTPREASVDEAAPLVITQKYKNTTGPPWTNILDQINACMKSANLDYENKNIMELVDYSNLSYAARVFPEDLVTVLSNIFLNAYKYSSDGATIRVFASVNEYTYKISIRNIGEQISEDEKNKIFLAEYRTLSSVERELEGTGLGLFISRSVCDQYDFNLTHTQRKKFGENLTWHDFSLEIPKCDVKKI